MTKKDMKKGPFQKEPQTPEAAKASPITQRGWKIIGSGVLTVVVGFIVLSFTDPQGQNFASHLSPFLIIGGYTLIGLGIIAKPASH